MNAEIAIGFGDALLIAPNTSKLVLTIGVSGRRI